MLGRIVELAIRNRMITLFFALLAFSYGLFSYYIIPKQENPDVAPPFARIMALYPGASPEEVERLVTKKIEDKMPGIKGYEAVESVSRNSFSTVILRLNRDSQVETSWDELRQKMEDLQKDLPAECEKLDINTDLDETAGIIISLSGPDYSYEQLANYAGEIKQELEKIKGLQRFEITGELKKEVVVEIRTAGLNQTGLSLEDVLTILKAQNTEIPSGVLNNGTVKINVHTPVKYNSLTEIENTIIDISRENGTALRLKDIARVYLGEEDSNYRIRHRGEKAVLLTGYFQDNKNIVLVGRDIEKALNTLMQKFPKNLHVDQVLNQSRDVKDAVGGFMINLLAGMLFVILVIFWGMGFRNALVISMAIPLSVLLTFCLMNFLDIKIHKVSIAALIVALGMMVDNAIVVSESIQYRIDGGDEKGRACVLGTGEVAVPVFTSTLTTVAAFLPLLTLAGIAGDYVRSIPQIVSLALMASFLAALFFTPVTAYLLYKANPAAVRVFSLLKSWGVRFLDYSLQRSRTAVIAAAVLFALTLWGSMFLPLVFFPKADKDLIYINITSEQSSNLERTEELARSVEEILHWQPEVLSYTTAVGNGLPKFFMTMPMASQSQDFAQIMVQVDLKKGKRFSDNSQLADYLQALLDTQVIGGSTAVKQLEEAEPSLAPVIIRLSGQEPGYLREAAENVKGVLKEIPGTVNVRDDAPPRVYEYQVRLDSERAGDMGITKYDVQKEINLALNGRVSSVFWHEGGEYNILVKSDIQRKEDLENLAVKSALTGNKVLLKQISHVDLTSQLPSIKRYNRERSVSVLSEVKYGHSAVAIEDMTAAKLAELNLEKVRVDMDGEKKKIIDNFGNLGIASVFAIFLIYIIMLFQFRSLVQPLIILLTIPLSVTGCIISLLIFRQPLSFTSLMGIVSLIGIVVNNAIVLLDYINGQRAAGQEIEMACRAAVERRFRPILLTTATTVIGLTPLALGGTLFKPMAVALMGGLLVSTLLTLNIIPVVYSLVEGRNERKKLAESPPV